MVPDSTGPFAAGNSAPATLKLDYYLKAGNMISELHQQRVDGPNATMRQDKPLVKRNQRDAVGFAAASSLRLTNSGISRCWIT
jgi:hypothetical protein